MSMDRRLARLEEETRHAGPVGALCGECDDSGAMYRWDFDLAHLMLAVEGKKPAPPRDVEHAAKEAEAKIRALLEGTPPELDRCPICGGLTGIGELRAWWAGR